MASKMEHLLCLLLILLLSTLIIACSNLVLCHSVVKSLPGFEGPLPFLNLKPGMLVWMNQRMYDFFTTLLSLSPTPKRTLCFLG
ncbi:hypothetical protein CsSME_00035789 [Camellia sinensis var. sinensis]